MIERDTPERGPQSNADPRRSVNWTEFAPKVRLNINEFCFSIVCLLSTVLDMFEVGCSALSEPLSLLFVPVASSKFPGLLSAFLDKLFNAILLNNMSDAVSSEEFILLAWADSISLSILNDVFAELSVASFNFNSDPLLTLLAGAWPELDVVKVLVFTVGWLEASLALLVFNLLSNKHNWLGDILSIVLSHDQWLAWLDALTSHNTDSKVSLDEESNGLGSLVHNEPCSPDLVVLA
jgi:hypothetical protein